MDTPSEEAAVEKVVDRLAARFPTLDHEHVEDVVETEVHEFDDARVRDYVPVIVEHQAMDRLREEADPVPLADVDFAAQTAGEAEESAVEADTERDPYEIEGSSGSAELLNGDISNN
ncbi:MAG: hypothetical protein ABW024_06975 [Microbacterium sp.]